MLEYYVELIKHWSDIKDALLNAWYIRLRPIFLTSITAILQALMITWDPVWTGLVRVIVFWLSASVFVTLIIVPIFIYRN